MAVDVRRRRSRRTCRRWSGSRRPRAGTTLHWPRTARRSLPMAGSGRRAGWRRSRSTVRTPTRRRTPISPAGRCGCAEKRAATASPSAPSGPRTGDCPRRSSRARSAPTRSRRCARSPREQPQGGARSPYAALRLWARHGADTGPGTPVLAFMVNGAQGDDDEAHGGHFAIVTGRVQRRRRHRRLAGQQLLLARRRKREGHHRRARAARQLPRPTSTPARAGTGPSTMLVAVLHDERAAVLVQSALNRVYNQFYRHQLVYYHPNAELHEHQRRHAARARAATSAPRTADAPRRWPRAGFPLSSLPPARSPRPSRVRLLRTDPTRLMPAAALEEILARLLALVGPPRPARRPGARLAALLARDARVPPVRAHSAAAVEPRLGRRAGRSRSPNTGPPSAPDPAQPVIVPVPLDPFRRRLLRPRPAAAAAAAFGHRRRVLGGPADRRHSRPGARAVAALAAAAFHSVMKFAFTVEAGC